ncbi:hypothetical protein HGG75_24890 [Ochrobactrum pseudogrignonense]|nr:hypothetical protein [Brucella pseudogrignonensis]
MKSSVYWMRRSLATRSATLLATTALTAILAMNTLPASAQLAGRHQHHFGCGWRRWHRSAGSATNWVDANGNNVAGSMAAMRCSAISRVLPAQYRSWAMWRRVL